MTTPPSLSPYTGVSMCVDQQWSLDDVGQGKDV